MKVGLLWYDDSSQRNLPRKVVLAAVRHRRKFGTVPDVCYVHPSAMKGNKEIKVGQVRVVSSPSVLRHHFWIGREKETQDG